MNTSNIPCSSVQTCRSHLSARDYALIWDLTKAVTLHFQTPKFHAVYIHLMPRTTCCMVKYRRATLCKIKSATNYYGYKNKYMECKQDIHFRFTMSIDIELQLIIFEHIALSLAYSRPLINTQWLLTEAMAAVKDDGIAWSWNHLFPLTQ